MEKKIDRGTLFTLANNFVVVDPNGLAHSDDMIRAAGMALRQSWIFREIVNGGKDFTLAVDGNGRVGE
jgi:hypothetical protein